MLLVALEDLTKVRACYASALVNITRQVYISDVTSATGICHLIFGGGNKTLEGAATACSPHAHGYERREEDMSKIIYRCKECNTVLRTHERGDLQKDSTVTMPWPCKSCLQVQKPDASIDGE